MADTGSVRAAAAQLVLTESAVSAAVTALGREVGVPLVERQGRGVRLTAGGQAYAGYARRLLGLLDEATAVARSAGDPARGRLRLAAVTSAGDQLLPGLLAALRARWPELELGVSVGPSRLVWAQLAEHRADVVLAGRPPEPAAVTVLATRANELVGVAAPALAGAGSLASTPWLLREAGSGTRAAVESYLAERGLDPPRLTLGSNGAVLNGALAGLGVALVAREAVRFELAAGRLAVLDLPGTPMRRPWHAAAGRPPNAPALLFRDCLLELADQPRWVAPSRRRTGS